MILLGLTAIFHLLGGIGTSCVALGAEKYDSMVGIVPFKWAYILFVLSTIAIAIYGIRATIRFSRNKHKSYRDSIIFLVIGIVISTIHMMTSRALRGSSMPNDARVYMNALTLIVFALFNFKKLREAMGIDANADTASGSGGLGVASVIMGLTTLNIHLFVQGTHTWNRINYADVWHTQLQMAGWGLVIAGIVLIVVTILKPDTLPVKDKLFADQIG
jgi:hypothetical protein